MNVIKFLKTPFVKLPHALQIVLLVCFVSTVISCAEDKKPTATIPSIVGEWLRNDFSENYEYRLVFYNDENGVKLEREGNENQGISNALTFKWTVDAETLTLDFNGDVHTSTYTINENGNLYIPGFSEHFFIKQN